MKALIIEDSKEIVESVSLVFQMRWPAAVVVATDSGEKGIQMTETEAPDVVILDIGLADMDGFEVLRQIRLFSDVPVVILTGRAIQEIEKIKGFELGVEGRTSRGKLARKMAQTRLMTASDDDLADLATYEFRVCTGRWTCQEILDRLIERREELRAGHHDGESGIH